MKIRYGIIIMICYLLNACRPTSQNPRIYDAGISQELAELRKQEISGLRYDLRLSIPEQKSIPVEGEIHVRFRLNKPQEIILDFREEADKIKEVAANGQPTPYEFCNEHIILPKSTILQGENDIYIRFTAGNQSLNRNDEFLYTLLVPDRARTVFPCFEQPNLKASFTLQLDIPSEWVAVSNTYINKEEEQEGRKSIYFAPTEPLSTYLFSFVAGKLERQEYQEGNRKIAAYFRETDPKKLSQLDTIFKQVMASLRWLEDYTGVPYPFAKYDFIILPGFQYGGMEHTGATLYNDNQMFLSEHPTPDEELRRTELIAHETAHMWFGDLVTMNWFDDVWTKEVFANYFAACISEPLYPEINHQLNRIKTFTASSLSEDRHPGTTSIRQPLDNLRNAGLIYGQIIYNKAPVMMIKLVELMGKDKFREGIREYLNTYAYSNATWDDLLRILDNKTTENLADFSDVWVNQKGMPTIRFAQKDGKLQISQEDPYHRGITWPQRFNVTLCGEQQDSILEVNLTDSLFTLPLPFTTRYILPNTDGRGYGLFIPDNHTLSWLLAHWQETADDTAREALLMLLYENYQVKHFTDEEWIGSLLTGLDKEKNPLIASTITGYLGSPLRTLASEKKQEVEDTMFRLSETHAFPSCRIQLLRSLIQNATSARSLQKLHNIWTNQSDKQLNERDYTTLAYILSLRMPEHSNELLTTQRQRLSNPDRLREFDLISRAVIPDTLKLNVLFQSLMLAENRRIEPWTATVLSYLNHPVRENHSVKYIRPALEALLDVQRTGDIFFPKNWVNALLSQHRSPEAYREVEAFLAAHPDYPVLLKNKILQAADPLYRANKQK